MPRDYFHEEFQHSRDEYRRDEARDHMPTKCDSCGFYIDDGQPGITWHVETCDCTRCEHCGEVDDGLMEKRGDLVCHDCHVAAAESLGEGDR